MSDLEEGSLTGEPAANNGNQPIEGSWEDPAASSGMQIPPVRQDQTASLPTWDQAIKQKLPTWDDAMKQSGPSAMVLAKNAINAQEYDSEGHYTSSPAVQEFMRGTSLGRVMAAFNEGFEEQTHGYHNLGIEPGSDTEKFLTKSGLMQDIAKNDNSIVKAITGGAMVMAAASLDAAMRTFGGILSGTGTALKQIGGPVTGIGEIVQAVPEGFGTEFAGGTHIPERPFTPRDFHEAKSAGVMDGENVYMGLKEPEPEQRMAQMAAAEQVEPRPEVPAFDIHAEARKIAPEIFGQYDRIRNQQDTLRNQLSTLSEERNKRYSGLEKTPEQISDEQATTQTAIDVLQAKKKLTDANQARLADLQNQLKELDEQHAAKSGRDTQQMAETRQKIQELDYKLRDLAPQVSEAYRKADVNNPAAQQPTNIIPQGATGGTLAEAPNALKVEEQTSQKSSLEREGQIINIRDDVAKKLIGAGRPPEEANAASALVEEHYKARSERFGGKLGTPEEMYDRDSATIKAGRSTTREKEFAQEEEKGFIGKLIDRFRGINPEELNQRTRGTYNRETNTITFMKNVNASTFIHETGHQWLEELMNDAQHPEAPADLIKDAKTVREWLGAKEDEELTRRQHEKFARGFERYMMEGIAPSKGLAAVFAKFRQWLTAIYTTVDRLRSPITDDIRNVFDRFLAKNPEKAVIAPEQEIGRQFADIHEADARTTPPEHAAAVRDNIEAEQDQLARTHNKEAYDALRSAEQTGAEPTQATGSQPIGPEPATAESGISAQPTEKQPSGSAVGTEGGGLRTEPAAANRTTGARSGEQAGENSTSAFRSKQPDLIDKAGNIRLDNLNTPEDVNKVLRAAAEGNDNFIGARRGIIPAAQQFELADALGMQPSDINFRKVGEAWNAEQILAARKMLIQSATNVRDLMAKAADGTDQDVLAYAEAKQRHLMIQEQVAGITAEAGRALGAFRKLEGTQEANALGDFLKQATGKDLFQLKQEASFGAKLETPEQISMFINATKKATFRDMILEYYINCLIAGPITHARYAVGNALNALWTPLVEIPTAAAIGKIREAVTRQDVPNRVYLGEAGAQLLALFKGSREGLSAAAAAFKTGVSPLLPNEHLSNNFANVKMNAIPGTVGQIINISGKSVSAIHSFFKAIRYEQNIQGLAYRTAMNEGLEGNAFNNRIADLIHNPTEDMMKESTANSLRELYMSPVEYNSFMGSLNRAINSNLAAKIIVPFMKIGSQITRNAFIERTPLGFLSQDIRENISSNSAATDMQLARIGTGIALIGATSLMTLEGIATGDGPSDPDQRRVWLLDHKPDSIQIGDISISYLGLGHLGMLMRFSANMTETAKSWDSSDGDKLAKSFFSLLEGANKSVLDENFMGGVKDLLDAVYHPEEYGTNYVRQFATNWLPFSVGLSQVARQIDPDYREAHTIFEAARAKIPFLSEGLQPKRDIFGEPIPTTGSVQNYENDPVMQRMNALDMGVGKLNRKIVGVPLTEQEYDDFSRISGRMAKMRLNALVGNPGFENLPQHVQIDTIHKIITDSRKTASSIVMMQNPRIIQQAKDAKLNALNKQ